MRAIVIVTVATLVAGQLRRCSATESTALKKGEGVIIVLTRLETNGNALALSYEIRNDSTSDVWLCIGRPESGVGTEVFMRDDGRTLSLRRRLNVPTLVMSPVMALRKYIRFRPGTVRKESVEVNLPVLPYRLLQHASRLEGLQHVTCLVVEIGYYEGNLPETIRAIMGNSAKGAGVNTSVYPPDLKKWFGSASYFFDELNQDVDTNEEIIVPYTALKFTGEHVLQITVDGVWIPYVEGKESRPPIIKVETSLREDDGAGTENR